MNIVYNIYYCIFIAVLFLGTNVASTIGYDYKMFTAILLGISIPLIFIQAKLLFQQKILLTLIIFTSLYGLFKLRTDTGEGTRQTVLQIISAPMLFAACPKQTTSPQSRKSLFFNRLIRIYFLFFIFETGMAVIERISGSLFLKHGASALQQFAQDEMTGFRSYALHGHPLQNALIVSTTMSFILFSGLKEKIKIPLWILGYLSILCFNTRSSIVGNALIFGCYVLYTLLADRKVKASAKRYLVGISVIGLAAVLWLITDFGWGDRLLDMGLFDDGSAQVRIDTWTIFNYFSLEDFLWGITHIQYQRLMYVTGLIATENFWIDWLLRLGLVFLVPFILLYFYFIRALYKGYSFPSTCFTAATFLLIASTNNSLSSTFVPLYVFIISIYLFNPRIFDMVVPSKYLSKRAILNKKKLSERLQNMKTQGLFSYDTSLGKQRDKAVEAE